MTKPWSRRRAAHLLLLGGAAGLAACSGAPAATTVPPAQPTRADSVATTAAPAVPNPTSAPPATATLAPLATRAPASPATASPAPPATTAAGASAPSPTPTAPGLAQLNAAAATRLLASLGEPARKKASYAFDDAERQRWHWTTPAGFPRNGLPLKEMSPEQRELALGLLRAGSSEAGYAKAIDIISLQRELNNDPELYYVTIFGTPGGTAPWGWRFEGHHLSRNVAITGDKVAMTPFFLGAWPTTSRAGLKAMGREEEAAREIVRSLDAKGRATAVFQARPLTEHVTQNQPRVQPLPPVGILAGDLAPDPRRLVDEILEIYLGILPVTVADPLRERLRAGGAETIRFGWAGGLEPRQPHYYRLQGSTFLLEFDNTRNGGTHIHSVWRDFAGDFGLSPA